MHGEECVMALAGMWHACTKQIIVGTGYQCHKCGGADETASGYTHAYILTACQPRVHYWVCYEDQHVEM